MQGKRVGESQVTLHHFMLPQHANPLGTIHGGVMMKLRDDGRPVTAPPLIFETDSERRSKAASQ
jgi:acyl-CoA hydrolase